MCVCVCGCYGMDRIARTWPSDHFIAVICHLSIIVKQILPIRLAPKNIPRILVPQGCICFLCKNISYLKFALSKKKRFLGLIHGAQRKSHEKEIFDSTFWVTYFFYIKKDTTLGSHNPRYVFFTSLLHILFACIIYFDKAMHIIFRGKNAMKSTTTDTTIIIALLCIYIHRQALTLIHKQFLTKPMSGGNMCY